MKFATSELQEQLVRPFASFLSLTWGGDSEQEYFSDGITEDLIIDLSKVTALSVLGRSTSFNLKGKPADARTLGRELDVSHILEGSVRKSGNRLRIVAQLIDAEDGHHLWAERYDRQLAEIFDVQDEISTAIVEALKLKLLPAEKKVIEQRGTSSPEAYDLYLMARRYWISGNDGDTRREQMILRLCERALDIDPAYARAWALMALAQSQLRFREGAHFDNGVAAAEQALSLDPTLPEPYAVRARFFHDQGQHDFADAEIRRALELDPESWEANKIAGKLQLLRGRFAQAVPYFQKAAGLIATDYHSLAILGTCYAGLGKTDAKLQTERSLLQRINLLLENDPGNGAALGLGASALASLGQKDRALDWIERALTVDPNNRIMRFNLACALANELNNPDRAISMLKPYFDQLNSALLHHVKVDPDLDPLRNHPEFQRMLGTAEARIKAGRQNTNTD